MCANDGIEIISIMNSYISIMWKIHDKIFKIQFIRGFWNYTKIPLLWPKFTHKSWIKCTTHRIQSQEFMCIWQLNECNIRLNCINIKFGFEILSCLKKESALEILYTHLELIFQKYQYKITYIKIASTNLLWKFINVTRSSICLGLMSNQSQTFCILKIMNFYELSILFNMNMPFFFRRGF
jgi:hypothetical protein